MADWDRFFQIVAGERPVPAPALDPQRHAASTTTRKPWVTHASIQNGSAVARHRPRVLYARRYRKPVVFDEVQVRGQHPAALGQPLRAEEMVHRFWQATVAGRLRAATARPTCTRDDVLWWSKGGVLHGESPARLAFLRRILEEGPAGGHEPIDDVIEYRRPCAGKAGEYYLFYFGIHQPRQRDVSCPRVAFQAS